MENKAKSQSRTSVVMMGATGAVGGEVVKVLLKKSELSRLTLLGRRPLEGLNADIVRQEKVDIFEPESYLEFLEGHQVAICTLGVGQPSKVSREDFIKVDKTAVLDFAKASKKAGIQHFELLSSVSIDSKSSSFYLRTKGELVDELKSLNFERLSIFQPSMILTPTNRYGFMQGVTLAVWPLLRPLLFGGLRKYRGVKVETLGKALAENVLLENRGDEFLTWDDFEKMVSV
ncbi:MAG: hypothetical protein ACI8YQ_004307 [Polaribacter sp.]|jgi:uncharacterized protein YbjT (DUF2867 family)